MPDCADRHIRDKKDGFYNWIPTMTRNLEEMPWHLPSHGNREAYLSEFGAILGDLSKKADGES